MCCANQKPPKVQILISKKERHASGSNGRIQLSLCAFRQTPSASRKCSSAVALSAFEHVSARFEKKVTQADHVNAPHVGTLAFSFVSSPKVSSVKPKSKSYNDFAYCSTWQSASSAALVVVARDSNWSQRRFASSFFSMSNTMQRIVSCIFVRSHKHTAPCSSGARYALSSAGTRVSA